MEFVTVAVNQLLNHTVVPVAREVGYVIFYKKNLKELKNESVELRNARDKVEHAVETADKNSREIESDVQKWLHDVDEIANKVDELEKDERHANAGCSCKSLPNLWSRHQLSRKSKKMVEKIVKIKDKGQGFSSETKVSRQKAPSFGGAFSSGVSFESRLLTLNKIMEALADPNLNKIGLWGMGGVGKTTLVEEVFKKAQQNFHVVVMATVTDKPDVKKIQGDIADMLGLKFNEHGVTGRANRLRERLLKEEKVLVILDDLWGKLELGQIGIPSVEQHNTNNVVNPLRKQSHNCKILLVSRNREVLSDQMNTQKNFPLEIMEEQEAWELFKDNAKFDEDAASEKLQSIAKKVAEECAGLPIAIVTVATSLKKKKMAEWKDVLRRLQNPASSDIIDMQAVINKTIEVSYENLENETLKSIFLLAGMIPHWLTPVLFKYCVGLGLFQHIPRMEDVRNSFDVCIRKLKDSCLLQDGHHGGDSFSMHDVVRDVVTSIGSKNQHLFFKGGEKLEKWPDSDQLKSCTRIFLDSVYDDVIPEGLNCPDLNLFSLQNFNPYLELPDNLFNEMPELKVLHLICLVIDPLPSSINFLCNLRALFLDYCVLANIEIVEKLEGLKVLSLRSSFIEELPLQLGKLSQLQLLDLTDCSKLELIPPNVLSSLNKLEELYMKNSFVKWDAHDPNTQQSNASLAELNGLSHLTTLEVLVPDEKMLPKDGLDFDRLLRYRIVIGDIWDWSFEHETLKNLKLRLSSETIHSESGHDFKRLLYYVEELHLGKLKGAKHILPGLNREGLPQLKHLYVNDNDEIQCIVDTSGPRHHIDLFPNLESMVLQSMMNLEKLCNGSLKGKPFSRLKAIKVKSCGKLRCLFLASIVRGLDQLVEIDLSECNLMEGIILNDEEAVDGVEFIKLHSLTLRCLPELMGFCSEEMMSSSDQPDMEQFQADLNPSVTTGDNILGASVSLFGEKAKFPNLETMAIIEVDKLNTIWQCRSQLLPDSFSKLKTLEIKKCPKLGTIFSCYMLSIIQSLETLIVTNCESLNEIFDVRETNGGTTSSSKISTQLPPQLNLQEMHVSECQRLKYLFPASLANSIPKLRKLVIENCSMMKEIMIEDNSLAIPRRFAKEIDVSRPTQPSQLKTPELKELWHSQVSDGSFSNLKTLKVANCEGFSKLLPFNLLKLLINMEELEVENCNSLEVVFDLEGKVEGNKTHALHKFHLRELILTSLPNLKQVWNKDPKGILDFQSLTVLKAYSCPSLDFLLPASVAKGLIHLQDLRIINSGIENVVSKEEGNDAPINFMFPEVTLLALSDLPNLGSFYPGRCTTEWPQLRSLYYGLINGLNIFESNLYVFQEAHCGDELEASAKQQLCVEKVMPNLEKVTLDYNEAIMTWLGRYSEAHISKLKLLQLKLINDVEIRFPYSTLQRMSSVETLIIGRNSIKEIFPSDEEVGEVAQDESAIQIKELYLEQLPKLQHICKEGHKVDLCLKNLEIFSVVECSNLLSLVPSSAAFNHLNALDVYKCEGLQYLMGSETAKSLGQLTTMSIEECIMIKEIIADEADIIGKIDTIKFSRLKELKLQKLPCLECFCSRDFTFEFPSLEGVDISQCPKMEIFSKGDCSTPNLRKIAGETKDFYSKGPDINSTVRRMYLKMNAEEWLKKWERLLELQKEIAMHRRWARIHFCMAIVLWALAILCSLKLRTWLN